MNISKVISTLKLQNGLYTITLPFKDAVTGEPTPIENVIKEVLETITVPTYSQYVPWIRECIEDVKNLKLVDKKQNIYQLPKLLCMTPVMYVMDVSFPYEGTIDFYSNVNPMYGVAGAAQSVITGQSFNMLAGALQAEPTFEDTGFNTVKLYGFPKVALKFTVACEHTPNLESIKDSCYASFMQLATLDLQQFLWNTLKMYNPISTAHGEYNLKIDQFEQAEGQRRELLNEWDNFYGAENVDWIRYM